MKIHAIRVTNLNSLYGDHTLDLDEGLQGASLFLIQGPTGAGKSTLMDAISLALFGTTPRLGAIRGEKDIAEQVMSRGEGNARAEVEFSKLAVGGRVRYRAAWYARRSRGKAGGNMQPTERSLERLGEDGAWKMLVANKRDKVTAPHFHDALEGFKAEDFQRSMLLAQGKFDAMLHAKPDERAEILERLTDTSIYQRIGEHAARVRGAWKRKLQALEQAREAASPMKEEERLAAVAASAEHGAAVKKTSELLQGLEAGHRWLLEEARLREAATAAGQGLERLEQEEVKAKDALQALAEHERCAQGFVKMDALREANKRISINRDKQKKVDKALPGLEGHLTTTKNRKDRAQSLTKAAEAQLNRLRGPAKETESALRQRSSAANELRSARAEVRAKETEEAKALKKSQEAASARSDAEAHHRASVKKAEALGEYKPLAEGLVSLQTRGSQLMQRRQDVTQEFHTLKGQEDALTLRQGSFDKATAAHEKARKDKVAPLEASWKHTAKNLTALLGDDDKRKNGDALLSELQGALLSSQKRDGDLKLAKQALETRAEAEIRLSGFKSALEGAQTSLEAAGLKVKSAEDEQAKQRRRLEEAEESLKPLERIAALGDARQRLEANVPCPLCGSQEHPFVDDPIERAKAEAIEDALALAQAKESAARQAYESARTQLGSAQVALAQGETHLTTAQGNLQRSEGELAQLVHRAKDALDAVALKEEASLDDVARAQGSNSKTSRDLTTEIEAVAAAIRAASNAERELRDAESELLQEGLRLEREKSAIQEAVSNLKAAKERLETRQSEALQQDNAFMATLTQLGVIADTPAQGLKAVQERVKAWSDAQETLRDAAQALEKKAALVDNANTQFEEAQGRTQAAQIALKGRREEWEQADGKAKEAKEALKRVWMDILESDATLEGDEKTPPRPGGDSQPQGFVTSQENHLHSLGLRREAAEEAHRRAEAAVGDAKATLSTLRDVARGLEDEIGDMAKSLQAILGDLNLSDQPALKALRLSEETAKAHRATRDTLKTLRTQAETEHKSAQARAQEHRARRPEELAQGASPNALKEHIAETIKKRDAHQDALNDARVTLSRAAQMQSARKEAILALQGARRRAQVWLELHDLIGVKDGRRFKAFAQSLNLQQLLLQANRHLRRLKDRYSLSQVKTPEGFPTLDFEIEDAFRPGTTRSLKTLSGGESFLVSLALALGLSDLRTSSMPIETLLLDEGFGTLDPSSLDTALAALQQLQADGRQVGIISHVAGLQERIEARILVEPIGEGRSTVRALVR